MDPYAREELRRWYGRRLDRHGDSPAALCWTPEGQRQRYEIMLRIAGGLDGKSLLDFGCGKGDLYRLLSERRAAVRYCGIDAGERFISLARRNHPGVDFRCLDIEEETLDDPFDIILVCGVFNLRVAGIRESMFAALRRLFALCRESLHLNVPSSTAVHKSIEMFYADAGELLDFALRELTTEATLRHGEVEDEIFLSCFASGRRKPPAR